MIITSITYPGSGASYAQAQAATGSCLATLRFRSYTMSIVYIQCIHTMYTYNVYNVYIQCKYNVYYTYALSCSSSKLSDGELLVKYYYYTFYSFESKFYPNAKVTSKVLTQMTMTAQVIMLTRIKSTSLPQ